MQNVFIIAAMRIPDNQELKSYYFFKKKFIYNKKIFINFKNLTRLYFIKINHLFIFFFFNKSIKNCLK